MRIAFISYEYPPDTVTGGIGTYTLQVTRLLAGENVDVHIFAGSHIQSGIAIENGRTVHRIKCSGPHDFQKSVVPYFEKEHNKLCFQLIESPEIHANALEIKKRFPALPMVVRLHASNWLVESFKKRYIPLQNKLRFFMGALRRGKWDLGYWRTYDYENDADYCFVNMATYISAPTEQMKKWAVDNWKINPDRIKVLENPFVENVVFKTARTNNEEHTIIFYGRLNVLKGLITATRAMKLILKNNPGWNWIIIGEDGNAADGKTSMKEWMEAQLREVRSQVSFNASVENNKIPGYLKQASIVLIPSLFESFSYVSIEAMSAGKAVVGSSDTGIASLIENNVNGKLADPYKIKEWIFAIQQLIDNAALRKQLGNAAFEYVANRYGINRNIVDYYKKLLTVNNVNAVNG